jgi:diguanylate cyclase
MNQEEHWRDRYFQLAQEQQALEQRHLDAERLLTRTIVRLCVAAGGLDPVLDPHLERLRTAARHGYSPALETQLTDLTNAIVAAGEQRRRGDLAGRLIDRLRLPGRQAGKAKTLWAQLAQDPTGAADSQLDELAQLLGWLPSAEPGRSGVLRRLFGGSQDRSPNLQLAELLARIAWPANFAERMQHLQAELTTDAAADAWIGVVEQLSTLVVEALEGAQREARLAEAFLNDLTERLLAIDEHIRGEGRRRQSARESADRLGSLMRAEVGDLSSRVRQGLDLEQLRGLVVSSLDRIQGQVRQHLDAEEALRREAEAREGELSAALQELEREADDLRRQVARNQQQALRDALTGLPNRRAYDERVQQEFARWRRFNEPLVLMIWDVDNFKTVNDVYGHKAGDRALQLIAEVLRKRLRETDFIARYGGEEFAVLLIGADEVEALQVAEGMRSAVAGAGLHSNNQPVEITICGGLSEFRVGDSVEAVFERADQALYQAKRAGKNRCVAAPAELAAARP